jgi:MYXO-CTERM domain-containing protein
MGDCVADPNASMSGGGSGGNGTGGQLILDDPGAKPSNGGSSNSSAGGPGAGPMLSSGQGDPKGCGCNIPGQRGSWRALLGLALAVAVGLLWRRRRTA